MSCDYFKCQYFFVKLRKRPCNYIKFAYITITFVDCSSLPAFAGFIFATLFGEVSPFVAASVFNATVEG